MENSKTPLDLTKEPENPEEYERLLTATPNSSALWIKFMVYYLQIAEIEKARSVAHQALKTIAYRDENERLNVWVALMNLENIHGTQANIEDVFNRATQNCDSFKVHSHLAEIYARSEKLEVKYNLLMSQQHI